MRCFALARLAVVAGSLALASGCVASQDVDEEAATSAAAYTLPPAIDYSRMSAEEALEKKYELMLPHCRGPLEREILAIAKKGLALGKASGLYADVTMEDLMTHARQEGNTLINALEAGRPLAPLRAIGTNLWDLHMDPRNDLLGNISWSVWQTTSNNYLRYGRKFDATLERYFQEHIVKYGLDKPLEEATEYDISKAAGRYRNNMKQRLGADRAAAMLDEELAAIKRVVSSKPEIHVLATAALIQDNYDNLGPRSPKAIRSYYWLEHQKNLRPEAWLGTVHASDIAVRGDYGKQIVLGNASNDRGMIFWYAVSGDRAAITAILQAWASDPSKLRKADYDLLKSKGFLAYASRDESLFQQIRALLP